MTRLDDRISERLRAEQMSAVMRHFPRVMLANIFNALIFLIANWGTARLLHALAWASIIWAITGVIIVRQRRRRLRRSASGGRRGFQHLLFFALALGLAWAALPLLFFADASLGGKLLIVCLSSGMLGGSVFVLSSVPIAAAAFGGPIAIGGLIALLGVGDAEHMLMALVLAGYSAVLFLGSYSYANELRSLIATQINAEERAQASAKNLGAMAEMTAGLAHEISQPLAAATAYIEAAQRLAKVPVNERPFPIERPLGNAATQLHNVQQIIAHLRDSIANRSTEKQLLSLHEVIQSVVAANRQRQENALVRIDVDLAAKNDLVLANAVKMRQIFNNLIANAIDAMESCSERALTISSHAANEHSIQVDVSDTGVGISPAIQGKLFDPLVTTKAEGLGVGLSITRSIIEEHSGKIWAQPNPNGGTVFTVLLPVGQ